jgi:hypothetical protein
LPVLRGVPSFSSLSSNLSILHQPATSSVPSSSAAHGILQSPFELSISRVAPSVTAATESSFARASSSTQVPSPLLASQRRMHVPRLPTPPTYYRTHEMSASPFHLPLPGSSSFASPPAATVELSRTHEYASSFPSLPSHPTTYGQPQYAPATWTAHTHGVAPSELQLQPPPMLQLAATSSAQTTRGQQMDGPAYVSNPTTWPPVLPYGTPHQTTEHLQAPEWQTATQGYAYADQQEPVYSQGELVGPDGGLEQSREIGEKAWLMQQRTMPQTYWQESNSVQYFPQQYAMPSWYTDGTLPEGWGPGL